MNPPTRALRDAGQSLWLDNITRDLLTSGTLQRYIDEWSVTGLTSNPTIFHHAIEGSGAYDSSIRDLAGIGLDGEALFFELALQDLNPAADLFREVHERTAGVDGWVSLEVSPLLADDARATIEQAKALDERSGRDNLFIKIPGTPAGLTAIEECIFAGVPVNVTLLFSREQCMAAADAYLRGLERRIDAGLSPDVASVASLFVSRWDVAVQGRVPEALRNQLGIAMSGRAYQAFHAMNGLPRWRRAFNFGARPMRLLLASTGTKDKAAPDVMYVNALAAPLTINTMPEATLKAFADHGEVAKPLQATGDGAERMLDAFTSAGIDLDALAATLQKEGAASFVTSWRALMDVIAAKAASLRRVA